MKRFAFLLMTMYALRAVSSNFLNRSEPYREDRKGGRWGEIGRENAAVSHPLAHDIFKVWSQYKRSSLSIHSLQNWL